MTALWQLYAGVCFCPCQKVLWHYRKIGPGERSIRGTLCS